MRNFQNLRTSLPGKVVNNNNMKGIELIESCFY